MVKLGQKVKDTVTGFEGIVTGRCEYLTGSTSVQVVPKVGPDGKHNESHWYDEERLEITDETPIALPAKTTAS